MHILTLVYVYINRYINTYKQQKTHAIKKMVMCNHSCKKKESHCRFRPRHKLSTLAVTSPESDSTWPCPPGPAGSEIGDKA